MAPKNKEQVAKVDDYFTEHLATVAMLVDKSTLAVATLYDAIQ